MLKRIVSLSFFLLMTAFATQLVFAGGVGIGNQNGSAFDEIHPWYKYNAPSDETDFGIFKDKDNPDDDERGPSEEDEGVMVWEDPLFFWRVMNQRTKGF
ncbi:MAG: hypothetical protein ISR91_03970 [Candidatus Delongbacteria bacterium]|nr:hypothetical protein [bacterium]MBL7033280.1 hypothetical protein [Candidatus Delongbacteria bacterium]